MTEWAWEPDDFAALWFSPGRDRFPFPLSYTSRFAWLEDVDQHNAVVRARYDIDEHELIELAFHTLTHAQLRVEILGDSNAIAKGTTKEYRVIGARTPHHAVLLTQTATTDGVAERIRCRLLRPEQLPGRLSWIVPECPAGRSAADIFHLEDLTSRNARSDSWTTTPRQRLDRFIHRPRHGSAWARLRAEPFADGQDPWFNARWLDLKDDGRYLMQRNREHLQLSPIGADGMNTLFTNWIDRALTRIREQAEHAAPAPWA
ncbi:ESX secretion-associated protein EspG [Nocardia sp. JW2]|uniref:ESX secretion-associated protein EspG n=1 Tax=Nocardia sp. JW2 TaxID=3450738 RepID=UPI003F41D8FD